MKKGTQFFLLFFLLFLYALLWGYSAIAMEWSVQGEATVTAGHLEEQEQVDWLVRYLPEIKMSDEEGEQWFWDAALAAYLYTLDNSQTGREQSAELFRAWARLYNDEAEIRVGLQELSFGPASFLRTLQWFDTKKPLDPTSFTKGVKGALLRISTEENSSFWLWSLYGNDDLYAATTYLSDSEKPEFGGRAQFSGDMAEWAVTLHHRKVELLNQDSAVENRLGVDLKLNLEYNGLWLESMLIQREADAPWFNHERQITLGIDYTLSIGEGGVVLTLERLLKEAKTEATDYGAMATNTVLKVETPQGLLDSLSLTLLNTQIPETNRVQFDWMRTYDDFLWNLSLFQFKPMDASAKYGVGLLFQYNH